MDSDSEEFSNNNFLSFKEVEKYSKSPDPKMANMKDIKKERRRSVRKSMRMTFNEDINDEPE